MICEKIKGILLMVWEKFLWILLIVCEKLKGILSLIFVLQVQWRQIVSGASGVAGVSVAYHVVLAENGEGM